MAEHVKPAQGLVRLWTQVTYGPSEVRGSQYFESDSAQSVQIVVLTVQQ
jgi:hypothetical protein